MVEPLVDIEVVTDNLGVAKTFNSGPTPARYSVNADLYHELYELTIDKKIKLLVR
jgi:hypothetical protein